MVRAILCPDHILIYLYLSIDTALKLCTLQGGTLYFLAQTKVLLPNFIILLC